MLLMIPLEVFLVRNEAKGRPIPNTDVLLAIAVNIF